MHNHCKEIDFAQKERTIQGLYEIDRSYHNTERRHINLSLREHRNQYSFRDTIVAAIATTTRFAAATNFIFPVIHALALVALLVIGRIDGLSPFADYGVLVVGDVRSGHDYDTCGCRISILLHVFIVKVSEIPGDERGSV